MLQQKLHTPPKLIVGVHVQQDANYQAGQIYAKGLVELAVLDAAACRPAPTATTTPALAMLHSLLVTTSPNALERSHIFSKKIYSCLRLILIYYLYYYDYYSLSFSYSVMSCIVI